MQGESPRTSREILTRSGGVFWGIVILIVGMLWVLVTLDVVQLNLDIVPPLLVLIGGIYLLVTKIMR